MLAILESATSMAAYMNGHDHKGGYAEHNGIHYLTFPAMVKHSAEQSCKVVDVFPDRLVVRGLGSRPARIIARRLSPEIGSPATERYASKTPQMLTPPAAGASGE